VQSPDGLPFVDVACGWAHSLALTHTGAVYTWGLNCKGQLGLGDLKARFKPQQVWALRPGGTRWGNAMGRPFPPPAAPLQLLHHASCVLP
jgi:hypothetical protein